MSYRPFIAYLLLLAAWHCIIPCAAQNSSAVYWMQKTDGYQLTKQVGESMLFYDTGGPDGKTTTAVTGYTVFTAGEGKQLTLTFTAPVDFTNPATHIYLYNGDCKYAGGASGDPQGWKQPVPAGYVADLIAGHEGTFTFPSGTCSVLYYSPNYYETGQGWSAVFTTADAAPMRLAKVEAVQDYNKDVYPARRGVELMTVNLLTEGASQPFTGTTLGFRLTGTARADALTNIRCCYGGGVTDPDGTPLPMRIVDGVLTVDYAAALEGGANYFSLVADVHDLAPAGGTVDVALVSVVTGGEQRLSSPIAPPQVFEIKNMLLMEKGVGHVYHIGNEARAFYDDGGADGNYSREFSGTATLVAATRGCRIHIDFNRLRLYTSSQAIASQTADVIRVYDGVSANPDSLLLEINTNDVAPVGVSSTGSALTVEFVSVHYVPAGGFEALVQQFVPRPAEIDVIESDASTDEPLNAGAAVEHIIDFNLHTAGTDPQLTLGELGLKGIGEAPCPVAGTLLYYGRDGKRLTPHILGKAVFNAEGMATIRLATPLTLLEGNNYFTIALDINPRALRGQSTGCTLATVTSNGITRRIDKAATRRVENVCRTYTGWQNVAVYEQWELHNPVDYNNTYGASDVNQIVTFTPGEPGGKVELTLDSFRLTWPEVSSRVGPVFEVYSGPAPSGELLWSVTKETAGQGPRKPLRSTAPNGELTVLFNPLGEAGASAQAGFAGRVYVVNDTPAAIQSVKTFAASTRVAEPGMENQPMLGIDITKAGTGNSPVIKSVTVDLSDSAPHITAVKIFAAEPGLSFGTDSLVAAVEVSPADRVITIPMSLPLDCHTTRLYMTYTLSPAALHGRQVSATLTAMSATCAVPAIPRCVASREIRPAYYYGGNSQTVQIPESGVMLFYDNAGADANYTTSATGTVTLLPPAGKVLHFEVEEFHTSPNDDFYIYSGRDASEVNPDRAALLWGKVEVPDTIWSDASDGSLSVRFAPQRNDLFPGWVIRVVASEPRPRTIRSVSCERVAKDSEWLYRDESPVTMLKVEVAVQGNTGTVSAPMIPLDMALTPSEAIRRIDWRSSGKSEDTTLLTPADVSYCLSGAYITPETHPGTLTFTESGRHYLWVAVELMPDAPAGTYVQLLPASRQIGVRTVPGYPRLVSVDCSSAAIAVKAYRPCEARVYLAKDDVRVVSLDTLKEATVVFTGLTPVTRYEATVEIGGERGTVVFTTGTAPTGQTPLSVTVTAPAMAEYESDVALSAQVSGGVPPYSYVWSDARGNTLSGNATTHGAASNGPTFRVEVTDATGASARAYAQVLTDGPVRTADFDDVLLPADCYWHGDTVAAQYDKPFLSGSFSFPTYWQKSWRSWARFAVVNSSAAYCLLTALHQFNSAAGGGASGSAAYAVAYVDPYFGICTMTNATPGVDRVIPGIQLTNTAWVRDAVMYGDGMSRVDGGMAHGDWLKLTVTGTRADGSGTSKEIYLADYRSDNPADRYVLTGWEWFPLDDLGAVNALTFTLDGTKRNQFGMTTPAYICIDEVGVPCPATVTDSLTVWADAPFISLADYFPAVDDSATPHYTLAGVSEQQASLLDVNTGMVKVTAPVDSRFKLTAGCMRKGHTEYVAIPVTVTDDDGVEHTLADDKILDIYTTSGIKLPYTDLTDLQPGMYIVRRKNATTKLIIK